jgi:hypothetical protein
MARDAAELPTYISLRYKEEGILETVSREVGNVVNVTRTKLGAGFAQAGRDAATEFSSAFDAVNASISRALSAPRNSRGSLDLGIGDLREAAKAQDARAQAAQEVATALRNAAQAEGDYSQRARTTIAAAEALAVEERNKAAAMRESAAAAEQAQSALDGHMSATDHVITGNRKLAASNDNVRYATMGATQQLQDMAVSLYGGQRAGTVMAQQLPQLAFALSALEGSSNATLNRLGKFATFMSGPWGLAIGLGVGVLASLAAEFYHTQEAAEAAKIGASGLSDAQSVLGDMFNLTSGKIEHQNELLKLNARLTALNLRSEALSQREKSRDAFGNFSTGSLGLSMGEKALGALGVPVYGATSREQQVRGVLGDLQSGKITREQALQRSAKLDFSGLAITRQQFQQALVDQVSAEFKDRTADLIDQSLDAGKLAVGLRRDTKAKKPKVDHSAERLAKFGDTATESIRRLNEKFDDSPKLIDQVAQATRELDALMKDLEKRKPIGWKQMVADAQATKAVVVDSLQRPLEDMTRESERRLKVQELLAQGRDDEAAAAQAVWSIEDKLGPEEELRLKVQALTTAGREDEAAAFQQILDKYPEMKRRAADLVEAEAQRTRELARQQAVFQTQIDAIDVAKRDLKDLFSGRKVDLFGDLKQAIRDVQGARLTDALFGGVFDQIEGQLRNRSPLGKATAGLVMGVDTAKTAITGHADVTAEAMQKIRAAIDGFDAASAKTFDDGFGNGEIVVAGRKTPGAKQPPLDLSKLTITQFSDMIAHGIVDPLLQGFDHSLGTTFFQNLSGTLSGVLSGKMQAGTVGAVLGGARGLAFDFGPDLVGKGVTEKILNKFDAALGGAQTGSQIAALGKTLGIKTSTTLAQLGGTAGALTGIPGADLIGSVVGGLLGGLFKKTKKGYANNIYLDASGDASYSLAGNSSSRKTAAGGAADDLGTALARIADQLHGDLNTGLNLGSLGVRKDKYTFDPTPGNSAGRQEFATQEEATRAAMVYAIDQGVIKGIRQSTQHLLSAGSDLDKALQNALDWENALNELKKYEDPLGAALDGLNSEFSHLIDLANQAGASAGEWASLEKLYGIKRQEAVDEAEQKLVGSLRGLLDDLTISNDAYSLRDRDAAARAVYDPLKARVAAGDSTAYDAFAKAAQDLLGIERELYGSQSAYFDRLNEVTSLTRDRISAETNVTSIANDRENPFDSAGKLKSTIDDQTEVLSSGINAVNINLGSVMQRLDLIAARLPKEPDVRTFEFKGYY